VRSATGDLCMDYRILGLSPEPFLGLYGLSDEELAIRGARRYIADSNPGFPDRIEMRDVDTGDAVLLVNHVHQPGDTPYRASHAIFVREGAEQAYNAINEVPEVMRRRPLSVRAFSAGHWMMNADLCDGQVVEPVLRKFLSDPAVSYLQVHYATRGCYAARIERA
jgi:Protein of unknown function (DUF1203)